MIDATLAALIQDNTTIVVPSVLPDISLRLVTFELPWWLADPKELEAQGIVDPYWAFCWPGGMALSRYLADRPTVVAGKSVMDFGAGCGVVAIAAAKAGAARVIACDIDQVALWACAENAALNGLMLDLEGRDLVGSELPGVDVLLVGDVTYSREMVERLIPWFESLRAAGKTILVADPGRGYLPQSLVAEATIRLPPDLGEVPVAPSVTVPIYSFNP